MIKRTVIIEDDLKDRIDGVVEDVKDLMVDYIKENGTEAHIPDEIQDEIHEYVDSAVPVYYSQIRDLWYLYYSDFEEAYENAGAGDNPRENDGMTAIYFYIEQEANDRLRDLWDELCEQAGG